MKISDLLKLSTDNLRRRKGRTALTVIGVVVGTCAIVVMISLGIATNRRTDEMLSTWSDLTQIQVFSYSENPDTPALDDKMVAQFKEMENVVAATPLYNFQSMNANVVAGKKDRYSMYMYNAVGMDVDAIEPMGIELVSGSYLTGQSLGRNKIPVLVGEDTAYQFEDTKKSYRNPDRYRWKETDENGNVIKQPFFDITKETLTMQMIYEYDDQGNPKMREYELVVVGVMKTDYSKRGTEGIITLEDILEELVGEIWDEHDEATEDFRQQSDGSWLVSGSASVDDLYETLGLPEDEDIDSNTVNGLVQEKTHHLPKVGDHFQLNDYEGVVTRTARRRVTEVRFTHTAPAPQDDEKDKDKRFSRLAQRTEGR